MSDMFMQKINDNDSELYYCHWQSVFASFQQVIKEIKERGLSDDIDVMNMDDFSDLHEIPMNDFIMLRNFNIESVEGNLEVNFNIGLSTYSDANNHRLAKLVSYVYGRYAPGKAMYILDEEGKEKAALTFSDGTLVNYISKSEMRSTQFITVTGLSTAKMSLYRGSAPAVSQV